MKLHHPIMSKLWDLGGRTQRRRYMAQKRQNGVETSTFGSDFTAVKNSVELITALRYKLRMIGVPIDGSNDIFCYNDAVYKNASTPESHIRKKHHSISYHISR